MVTQHLNINHFLLCSLGLWNKSIGVSLTVFLLLARDSTITQSNQLTLYKLLIRSILIYVASVCSSTCSSSYLCLQLHMLLKLPFLQLHMLLQLPLSAAPHDPPATSVCSYTCSSSYLFCSSTCSSSYLFCSSTCSSSYLCLQLHMLLKLPLSAAPHAPPATSVCSSTCSSSYLFCSSTFSSSYLCLQLHMLLQLPLSAAPHAPQATSVCSSTCSSSYLRLHFI